MPAYAATIRVEQVPDTDSSPYDYLPRDYRAESAGQTDDQFKVTDEQIAAAEKADAEIIASWKRGDWRYWGIVVTATISTDVDGHTFTTEEDESLWGVDDVDPTYPDTVAAELRETLVERLRGDYPGIAIDGEI